MDPFSSLNLARSTIQFIDLSSNLLSGAYEIYHSPDGLTRDDVELGERTAILRKLAFGLANRLSSHVVDNKSEPSPSQPITAPDSGDASLEKNKESTADPVQEKTRQEDESYTSDGLKRDDVEPGERTAILRKPIFGPANRSSSHVVDNKSQPSPSQPITAPDSGDASLEENNESAANPMQEKKPQDESNNAIIQLPDKEDEDNPMGAGTKLGVEQAYKKLQKLTSEMKLNAKAFAAEDIWRSEQEQNLQRVAVGCDDIAKKLEATLKQLRVDPKNTKFRKISSFRQAFVKICSQRKIDEMERSLDKYRTDLILQLSVIMRYDFPPSHWLCSVLSM